MEEILKIDPPTEKLNKGIDDVLFVEVFISIFSREPIQLGQSRDVPVVDGPAASGGRSLMIRLK